MAAIVRLRPHQTKVMAFSHPLLEDLETYTERELNGLALLVAGQPHNEQRRDALLMALRLCLRSVVGRFLRYWPQTRRFEEDMVSVGFLALTRLMDEITSDFLKERSILKVAIRRVEDNIQQFINKEMAISAPCLRIQKERLRDGKGAVHLEAVLDIADLEEHPNDDGDEWKRDFVDVVATLPEDEIDEAVLDRFNWGRRAADLAEELGVSERTINRRRQKLCERLENEP